MNLSIKRVPFMALAVTLLTCGAGAVSFLWAQDKLPAAALDASPVIDDKPLHTCQTFATGYYRKMSPDSFESIALYPAQSNIDKEESTLGRQFISSLLTGVAAMKYKDGPPAEVQFMCFLESDEKAVFFRVADLKRPDPVQACASQTSTIGESIPCLKETLAKDETQLNVLENNVRKAATAVDAQWKTTQAKKAFEDSDSQWQHFRDSECERRLAASAGKNHPDITRYECRIQKTRERIQDLTFDSF